MRRREDIHSAMIGMMLAVIVFGQGCATSIPRTALAGMPSVRIVRHVSPPIKCMELGKALRVGLTHAPLVPLAVAAVEGAKTDLAVDDTYPDFAALLVTHFARQLNTADSTWPKAEPLSDAVESEAARTGAQIEFRVGHIMLGWLGAVQGGNGFFVRTTATFTDASGAVRYKREFIYSSAKTIGSRPTTEYLADNGKLLRQEINLAAEAAASFFVKDMTAHLR